MKTEEAQKIMAAAKVKAAEIGKPVSICILDAAGIMVMFERVNNPPAQTALIAEGKAQGSALTGRDSVNLVPMQERPAVANLISSRLGGRFAPMQGAVVITDANGTVGAIGVSGATSEEDETIAKAGLAAFK